MHQFITVRRAECADASAVAGLFQRSINGLASSHYSPSQIATWVHLGSNVIQWEKRIRTQYFILGECDGSLAGFLGFEDTGHVDTLYVDPDYARKGIATTLLKNVEGKSVKDGLKRLFSEVSISARPFFEAHGFDVLASQTVERDGVIFQNYRMQKIIG